ncbi:hypothetical protein B0T11DRAFT_298824 [Plectosphaerella cucumerina]|uniref:SNF2 N-terminal domain-containing protein n=1 Tax=Plectosphaerella cucumerina TaxID=40658 RepID=A0A8K0X687_9PEZI|nr:hypothetical protein B0T11DRAFT_298824 [Plectosphaerella cucumerina]
MGTALHLGSWTLFLVVKPLAERDHWVNTVPALLGNLGGGDRLLSGSFMTSIGSPETTSPARPSDRRPRLPVAEEGTTAGISEPSANPREPNSQPVIDLTMPGHEELDATLAEPDTDKGPAAEVQQTDKVSPRTRHQSLVGAAAFDAYKMSDWLKDGRKTASGIAAGEMGMDKSFLSFGLLAIRPAVMCMENAKVTPYFTSGTRASNASCKGSLASSGSASQNGPRRLLAYVPAVEVEETKRALEVLHSGKFITL